MCQAIWLVVVIFMLLMGNLFCISALQAVAQKSSERVENAKSEDSVLLECQIHSSPPLTSKHVSWYFHDSNMRITQDFNSR